MPGRRPAGLQLLPLARRAGLLIAPSRVCRFSSRTVGVLDRYAAQVLACDPARARRGGVHVVPAPLRGAPAWLGYVLPVIGLSFPEGAVIAARADLAEALRAQLGSDLRLPSLDAAALKRVYRAIQRLAPHAFTLMGAVRAVDADTFQPTATITRAECIPRGDPAAMHLRHRFDGEIFGVRGPRGPLVSWAALKLKSEAVWEIAVATEADYRGRGFARDVVAAATRYTLEQGRIPLYVHDYDNSTSAFVCRSLGYRLYAEVLLAEY